MKIAQVFVLVLMTIESGASLAYAYEADWRRSIFWFCSVVVQAVVTF